jgi:tetratricopeptide (TPR) repeat protein
MLDFAATAERYERAFREYGVDPLALDPNAAANLLGALAGDARVDLAAALDDWAYVGSTARLLATFSQLGGKPPQDDRHQTVGPLFAVTRLLDPDPFRKQLREAITNNDGPALKRLVEEIDPAAHPAQTIHLATLFLSRMEPSALEAAIRLLRRSHPHHSGDFHVNHDLTYFLLQSQQPAEALPYAAAAVALRPHSAVAWHNWAVALERAGRPTDAVAALRRVYTLSPANLTSRVWAIALLDRTGDRVGAAAVRDELNKLAPNPAHLSDAYLIIGVGFRAEGDRTAAEAALREAIRHNPKQVGAYQQLASMLRRRGELNASMDVYREGIRCVPYWIGGLNDLAWLLATGPIEAPDRQEAVRLATEACRLTGRKNPALLDTLAAAHAAADDFKQAVSVQEEALRLEASAKRPDNGGHDRLELYRRNISYRETSVVLSESGPPPREVTP